MVCSISSECYREAEKIVVSRKATILSLAQASPGEVDFSIFILLSSLARPAMLPQLLRSRALLRGMSVNRNALVPRRTLIAAPKPGDGPLMSRRADRELPGKLNDFIKIRYSHNLKI